MGPVDFAQLALVILIGIGGPLLAWRQGWHLPVVLGELLGGLVLGRSGFGYLDAREPSFMFLANIGFALVMFVAGTHVPLRAPAMRSVVWSGVTRAAAVGIAGAAVGWGLAWAVGVPHAGLYAALLASSSAALILPVIESVGLGGPRVLGLLPQIAVADAAAIVVLPLAIDSTHASRAALGALVVLASAVAAYFLLREVERRGWRHEVHEVSEDRSFALELRVQLTLLFAMAALAATWHVTTMLAGFTFGLAVAAIGQPRRIARQMFALTEGFLGPVFFVWLGAELQVRDLVNHPRMVWLGLGLGLGAVLCHLVPWLWGQPLPLALLATAQLGVPVAAATVGSQLGVLEPGEASALVLGALVTIAVAIAGGALAGRRGALSDVRGAG